MGDCSLFGQNTTTVDTGVTQVLGRKMHEASMWGEDPQDPSKAVYTDYMISRTYRLHISLRERVSFFWAVQGLTSLLPGHLKQQ